MNTIMEQDALARTRISSEIDRNFFVEAAAGSGKTTSLVDRMIAMVGAGINVSRICAITFTKAAAREFYHRFQEKLAKYSREEKDETRRQLFEDALHNIDLCFMGTIDSFSDMLLHEHPIEAGMPSETAVCAETDAKPQYLAEYARIKCGGYGEELQKKYELFRSVQTNADEVFAKSIGIFTERREADFVYTPPQDTDVNALYTNWKYKFVRTLSILRDHPEYAGTVKETQTVMKNLSKYISIVQNLWNERIGVILDTFTELNGLRLGIQDKQPVTPEMIGTELPEIFALHEAKKGTSYYYLNLTETDVYRQLRKLQYAATLDFLVSASAEIASEMREKGTMTFHDALLTLRDMLRKDAADGGRIIRHIAKRHSYYLVDEFQDTDPLQAEVVFYLAAQEPVPDWTACIPRPGALFIVGDPKQSIYRFRGADVASFLRVRSLFAQGSGEVLTLSRNFRSTVRMRTWFNTVFPKMLTETENVQSGFYTIPIGDTETDTESTGIYTYRTYVQKGCKSLADDPERVADVIRLLIGNPAIRLKNGESPKFSDIMVIAYRKKQTAQIAKQLFSEGIPVRVEGRINFSECPSLIAVTLLFCAVSQPQDAMAVFKALRSDVFRISETQIRQFCSIGGKLNVYAEQDEKFSQFPALQSAFAKLREYANMGRSLDSAALLEMISDDSRLFTRTGSQSLEYYCYALELLRQKESDGEILNHIDAAEFLCSLLTATDTERCVSLSPDDNRVHIANLHKVKGLEAPIVILADPFSQSYDPNMRVIHASDRTECRIFSLKNKNSKIAETDAFSSDFIAECECQTAEKLRLLYVAATRAENILIVGDSIKENGELFERNPWQLFLPHAEGTAAAIIPENPVRIEPMTAIPDGDALYRKAAERSVLANTAVKEPSYAIVRPSRMKLKPVTADEVQDRKPIERNAALTGTLVHRLMECIVSGGVPNDSDALISSILHEFDAGDTEYRPILRKVLDTMRNGGFPQENGTPADLLSVLQSADEVYCELPFCRSCGGEIVHGVIDLLYRSGDAWQIIDYKTNAESAQLAEKYASQLDAYRTAVKEMIGADADAAIYHIDV